MKYNYEILEKHIPTPYTEKLETHMKKGEEINKEALHKLHYFENKKLFGLLTDSLYKKEAYVIADTFKPTFNPNEVEKGEVAKKYTDLYYNFNVLNDYQSKTNNISNNYLKNVIKSIYKDINNNDIKFSNDDSKDKFEFKIDKSDLANPVDSILHKANNITGEGFFINYITNIIIIIVMYNIGKNI